MKTVADIVREIVLEQPFLEEGLATGLVNISGLARKIQPQVEEALLKPVSEGALVMALRRLAPQLEPAGGSAGSGSFVQDVAVRSDLVELTFLRSESLLEGLLDLLAQLRAGTHRFVTFTQGVFEVTTILDAQLVDIALTAFKNEKLLARLDDLSAITIRLTKESVYTPGVHYGILKQLALREINVVEEVSTYTEFTVILERSQVDRAFSVLMEQAP